ncbi:hypothetical protein Pcinc_002174 [Petrolisthes cinctipes]|uniref:Uncharacterized protein n=1 Tax=Petrolisthes cinctipes TaxID=88211 RepID=A0AAE1GKA9_PETCI|nr:hypothetical protein Pcinc_002174 [Petrolisthes cinctipes]
MHAHQTTLLTLHNLQKEAFLLSEGSKDFVCFNAWKNDMQKESHFHEDDSESAKHRGRRAEEKQRRKICSVFLTHHKKIQPLLKLLLLEELNHLNFIVPIAALSLRIPPSKPSC